MYGRIFLAVFLVLIGLVQLGVAIPAVIVGASAIIAGGLLFVDRDKTV